MRRQPKARGTKSKSRIEAFHELKEKASRSVKKDKLELDMKETRQGGKLLECHHLSKSFADQPLINDFSYIFKKHDRIGIAGQNGAGKSTFLNLITSREEEHTSEHQTLMRTSYAHFCTKQKKTHN